MKTKTAEIVLLFFILIAFTPGCIMPFNCGTEEDDFDIGDEYGDGGDGDGDGDGSGGGDDDGNYCESSLGALADSVCSINENCGFFSGSYSECLQDEGGAWDLVYYDSPCLYCYCDCVGLFVSDCYAFENCLTNCAYYSCEYYQ